MAYVDFLSSVHIGTAQDYLVRVNDLEFPRANAAELAIQWALSYRDGNRRICYGGYPYIPGGWAGSAQALIDSYSLKSCDKILDVGFDKVFLSHEISLLVSGLETTGLDISEYAPPEAKEEICDRPQVGNANALSLADHSFDLAFLSTTLRNSHNYDLVKALGDIQRVGKTTNTLTSVGIKTKLKKQICFTSKLPSKRFARRKNGIGGSSRPATKATIR